MILVTGAGGKTGQAVIRALVEKGEPVRALVRKPDQIEPAKAIGAVEVEVGDLLDPDTLEPIFAGMRAIYHIGPNAHPAEVDIGRNSILAAQGAGVPHFVMHSVLHPQIRAMPHHWSKLNVEEMLIDSNMGFTILQPASYMQNILGVWNSIMEGRYPVPYPTNVRFSPVDLEDIAQLAAVVLSSPGHEGAIYELAGPELLTPEQIARQMGDALGLRVEAEEVSRDEWRSETAIDPERADILIQMFAYYAEHGFWGNARVLAGLLGREPTTFKRYLQRLATQEAKSGQ